MPGAKPHAKNELAKGKRSSTYEKGRRTKTKRTLTDGSRGKGGAKRIYFSKGERNRRNCYIGPESKKNQLATEGRTKKGDLRSLTKNRVQRAREKMGASFPKLRSGGKRESHLRKDRTAASSNVLPRIDE